MFSRKHFAFGIAAAVAGGLSLGESAHAVEVNSWEATLQAEATHVLPGDSTTDQGSAGSNEDWTYDGSASAEVDNSAGQASALTAVSSEMWQESNGSLFLEYGGNITGDTGVETSASFASGHEPESGENFFAEASNQYQLDFTVPDSDGWYFELDGFVNGSGAYNVYLMDMNEQLLFDISGGSQTGNSAVTFEDTGDLEPGGTYFFSAVFAGWSNTQSGGSSQSLDHALNFSVIPEPGTLALMGLGGAMVLARRRKRTAA